LVVNFLSSDNPVELAWRDAYAVEDSIWRCKCLGRQEVYQLIEVYASPIALAIAGDIGGVYDVRVG
jgi:hypothetical protein